MIDLESISRHILSVVGRNRMFLGLGMTIQRGISFIDFFSPCIYRNIILINVTVIHSVKKEYMKSFIEKISQNSVNQLIVPNLMAASSLGLVRHLPES